MPATQGTEAAASGVAFGEENPFELGCQPERLTGPRGAAPSELTVLQECVEVGDHSLGGLSLTNVEVRRYGDTDDFVLSADLSATEPFAIETVEQEASIRYTPSVEPRATLLNNGEVVVVLGPWGGGWAGFLSQAQPGGVSWPVDFFVDGSCHRASGNPVCDDPHAWQEFDEIRFEAA